MAFFISLNMGKQLFLFQNNKPPTSQKEKVISLLQGFHEEYQRQAIKYCKDNKISYKTIICEYLLRDFKRSDFYEKIGSEEVLYRWRFLGYKFSLLDQYDFYIRAYSSDYEKKSNDILVYRWNESHNTKRLKSTVNENMATFFKTTMFDLIQLWEPKTKL